VHYYGTQCKMWYVWCGTVNDLRGYHRAMATVSPRDVTTWHRHDVNHWAGALSMCGSSWSAAMYLSSSSLFTNSVLLRCSGVNQPLTTVHSASQQTTHTVVSITLPHSLSKFSQLMYGRGVRPQNVSDALLNLKPSFLCFFTIQKNKVKCQGKRPNRYTSR